KYHHLLCFAGPRLTELAHSAAAYPLPPPHAEVRPTGHLEHNLRLVSQPTPTELWPTGHLVHNLRLVSQPIPHSGNNASCLAGYFQTSRRAHTTARLLNIG